MIKQVMMALAVMTGVTGVAQAGQFNLFPENVYLKYDSERSEEVTGIVQSSNSCGVETDRRSYHVPGRCSDITWGQFLEANRGRGIVRIQGVRLWSHPHRTVYAYDQNGEVEAVREARLRNELANDYPSLKRLETIERGLIHEYNNDNKQAWKQRVAAQARHARMYSECARNGLTEQRRQTILRHGNGGGSTWAWISDGEWRSLCESRTGTTR